MCRADHQYIQYSALTWMFFLLCPVLNASEVTFLPLESVLDSNTRVFEACIFDVTRGEKNQQFEVIWSVTEVTDLTGRGPVGIRKMLFRQINPVVKDTQGKVIISVSPILEASGIEFVLLVEKKYLFLSWGEKIDDDTLLIYRVEEVDKKEKILTYIENLFQQN